MSKYKQRGVAISLAKRMSKEEFMNRSNITHDNKYDYTEVEYVNAHTPVTIICPIHGSWKQRPQDHYEGGGCLQCGIISRGKTKSANAYKKFLITANEFHGGKYTYLHETFAGMTKLMSITCPIHGEFTQVPDVHRRAGCQRCGHGPISEASQDWLNSLAVDKADREQLIKIGQRKFKVDAYNKDSNTIYEYWGDYWHGNPKIYSPDEINKNTKKSFGELYIGTLNKISLIESAGYNLIQIWESDWLKSISDATK